jgi:hypothetical protein
MLDSVVPVAVVAGALLDPGELLGARVQVRADRRVVRMFHRSQLIKVHPRQPPGCMCTTLKSGGKRVTSTCFGIS